MYIDKREKFDKLQRKQTLGNKSCDTSHIHKPVVDGDAHLSVFSFAVFPAIQFKSAFWEEQSANGDGGTHLSDGLPLRMPMEMHSAVEMKIATNGYVKKEKKTT